MEIRSEIVEYLQRKFSLGTEQCKFSEISSAYHFNGIVGNSGEISNMVAHPSGMFSFSDPFFSLLPEILVKFCTIFSTPPLGSARLFTVIIPGGENERVLKI